MSNWQIDLKSRKVTIEVKKILQRWPEYTADLPGMEILDQHGKKHTISYLDFTCTIEEWDQIQEGSQIEVTLQESIINPKILPKKPSKNSMKGDTGKLINYLTEKGVNIDSDVKKIIEFFNGMVLVRFLPSGFGHTMPSLSEKLAQNTKVPKIKTEVIMSQLERLGLLKDKKGTHSIGGAEYEYGFTDLAKSIMER